MSPAPTGTQRRGTANRAARRSFAVAKKSKDETPFDFDFELGPESEFTVYPHLLTDMLVLDVSGYIIRDDRGEGVATDPEPFWDFWRAVFGVGWDGELKGRAEGVTGEQEFERFRTYVKSPKAQIPAELIDEIMGVVMEAHAGRPI